jgi:type IV secretory pathway VirD2 relaxase
MNFYQYVQSFSPEENITPQKAHEVALEFAEKAWTGYEVLVATHCDAQHIHSHFVINSVSFENGKKLRQNPNTLKSLRALSDEIFRQHSLSTLEAYSKNGIKISTNTAPQSKVRTGNSN